MMRLVTNSPLAERTRRKRHGSDDLAVVARVAIEIDDCQKIWRFVRLVARPDDQLLFLVTVTAVVAIFLVVREGRCPAQKQPDRQCAEHRPPPRCSPHCRYSFL